MWEGARQQPRADDPEYTDVDDVSNTLCVAHIDLTRELRGGPRQMLALVQKLSQSPVCHGLQQTIIVRRGTPVAVAARQLDDVAAVVAVSTVFSAARAAREADIVHVHDDGSVPAGALLSQRGIPFVVTRRSTVTPKVNFATRWSYSRASRVVGVSDRVSALMKAYLRNGNVTTIPDCAVRIPRQTGTLRNDPHRDFVVGCVGTIDFDTKGQDLLMAAARRLLGSCPQVELLVIGDGPDARNLQEMAASLPNVRMIAWQSDMSAAYGEMDLLVQPSRFEALGSTILEAMSVGLPVVASDVGGIPEIVQGEVNGLLVPANAPDHLASAIARLANDEALLRRLGASAARTASRFGVKRMAEDYWSTYLNVLASEQARRLTF